MGLIKLFAKFTENFFKLLRETKIKPYNNIVYRVVDIKKDVEGIYLATIQVIGNRTIFATKPEELLSDDKVINNFSQKDIRNLTYLGYLNTNNPKYTVIATNHSNEFNKMILALNKKGDKKPIITTADQISTDENILTKMSPKDAHLIGFVTATEQTVLETNEKKKLKRELLEKLKQEEK